MLTPRLLSLAAAIALTSLTPVWDRQDQKMSAGLVKQLQVSGADTRGFAIL